MSDVIKIIGLRAFGHHGVLEHEKINGQEFVVDAMLFLDLSRPSVTDDLNQTVNYSLACDAIAMEIAGAPVELIERLAGRISERLLTDFSAIEKVQVEVHKPSAPVDHVVKDISVRIERSR